jgi:integrase
LWNGLWTGEADIMRGAERLTAVKVAKLRAAGRYGDGRGLWLHIGPSGSKSWVLRYMRDGRAREMGLGPLDLVSLADARQRAREARRVLLDGRDPIDAKHEQRAQRRLDEARSMTFSTCAARYIAGHEAGWRNAKHRGQWQATLTTYAYPVFAELPVAAVDTGMVLKVLEPIWTLKPETAGRVRGRIERVLDWATARGYRHGDNPARWRGHLDKLLPARAKVRKVAHHAALPYVELPAFMGELRIKKSISARALEFTILTACRTGEVIGATWGEIDLDARTWTLPAWRMKAEKELRVPLGGRAVEILKSLQREAGNPHVFIGGRRGAPLSNMAMLELMKGLRPGYVPHGFRSTFRDWAAERTNYPNHVVEKALAHVVADKVEAAYRRGDLFEKRRRLMNEWGRYCASSTAERGAVVPMRGAGSRG